MQNDINPVSHRILFLNTLAFTICFAVWTFNGVMVTYLVNNNVFQWGPVEVGWLLGIPILTGSVLRLPLGILTDRYGGKWVFVAILIACAIPMIFIPYASSFTTFALLSFIFGLAGASFAVGIGFTSVWYPKHWQGRALGIFGAGNAGAALTTLFAPTLLNSFTNNGENIENWVYLPLLYAAVLIVMAVIFMIFSVNKKPDTPPRTLKMVMKPLGNVRVWRFGYYYFLVFGCFVAFSQWLVPYFMNVYGTSLVVAGLFASLFSLPSGVIRALGGWMSDKMGARRVMFGVFKWSIFLSVLLMIPKMDIFTPGKGIISKEDGTIKEIRESSIVLNGNEYDYKPKENIDEQVQNPEGLAKFLPYKYDWQEPVVQEGDQVKKKELLAKGTTLISFQANMWIYIIFMFGIGITWGIGKAGVYRFIPDYFPNEVGIVGGMVGVMGGLGGFVCPILFGYLLDWTGLWTSSWMLVLLISTTCFFWLQKVVQRIIKSQAPDIAEQMEEKNGNN